MIDNNYDWAFYEYAQYGDEIDDLPCALHVHRFGRTEHYRVIGHDLLHFERVSIDNTFIDQIDIADNVMLIAVTVDDIDALLNTPFA